MSHPRSEIQSRASFSAIRYAQCWEDASLLIGGLHPEGKDCLSIGSAGDNSFALLGAGAKSVTVVEMNPAQIACIELRQAAYCTLSHSEFLELHGSRPSDRRLELFDRCVSQLPAAASEFWNLRRGEISGGIGASGKFENYFGLFRKWILPMAHPRRRVQALLTPRDPAGREEFYESQWNNWRWRWIFRCFFSRTIMGWLGRDPEFFHYVEGSVAERILGRTRHALVALDPSRNPYLHWILTGTHGSALPPALEPAVYDRIRQALQAGRMEIVPDSLEALIADRKDRRYDAFNLSDIFEYMSLENTTRLLESLLSVANSGARLAYWNMLAPRSRPESLAHRLRPCTEEAERLFHEDRAFFYSRFVLEEVV